MQNEPLLLHKLAYLIFSFKETEYEDVGVKSVECNANAIELDAQLHSGNFCEVAIGIVRKLKGCSQGMRVVVKKNKGMAIPMSPIRYSICTHS